MCNIFLPTAYIEKKQGRKKMNNGRIKNDIMEKYDKKRKKLQKLK